MSTKNIVLFGQSGAGKSSVVNLMAGEKKAETSPGTERCTMHWEEHPITFDRCIYKVFDTVGLEEPQLGKKEYLDVIVNAYNLIKKLNDEGGIDLLLFCVRAGRFTSTIQNNYRLFYEWLCEQKVPIVLVLTGLEREQNMDDWWTKYGGTFDKHKIIVNDHACITAANGLEERHQELYQKSRQLVHSLVIKHTRDRQEAVQKGGNVVGDEDNGQRGNNRWIGDNRLVERVARMLKGFLFGKPSLKKKDIATVLTKRCGMSREVANELAKKIGQDPNRKLSI
ncbi:hypothetical protein M405DRAFT_785080 [Rhizopogon salebrosus TDB-379]|nr:hypothetical protein M405DRAFT_785080 [Rhizopogon salebrosus TDB-379]